jgi:hypothetical protein
MQGDENDNLPPLRRYVPPGDYLLPLVTFALLGFPAACFSQRIGHQQYFVALLRRDLQLLPPPVPHLPAID